MDRFEGVVKKRFKGDVELLSLMEKEELKSVLDEMVEEARAEDERDAFVRRNVRMEVLERCRILLKKMLHYQSVLNRHSINPHSVAFASLASQIVSMGAGMTLEQTIHHIQQWDNTLAEYEKNIEADK
jgi:hypothetical protein